MATEWISPTWRMPEESNQSKFNNYSLDFDGTADYVDTNDSTLLSSESWSISVWFKWSTLQSGNNEAIISTRQGSVSLSSGFDLYLTNNDTILRARTYSNGVGAEVAITLANEGMTTDVWYHACVVYDSGTLTFKINNGDIFSGSSTGNYTASSNSLTIGKWSNGANYHNGEITEVSIFDYALSTDQINYLYNSGTPVNPMAISGNAPIAYYPLGGSSTGSASTLTVPNESVPSATVFNFDTQDYIQYPHVNINGAFTVSTWVKTTDTNTYGNLFSSSNQFGGGANILNNWKLMRWSRAARFNGSDSSNSIIFDVNTGTSGTRPNLYDGNWHHVLAIWDGTTNADGIKIFFDGVLKGLGTASSTAINTDSSIPIRAGSSSATFDFIGEQSNQQIWNIALTYGSASADGDIAGGEVATIYNNGTPYTGTQPQAANLKAWYKLNVDTSVWNSVLNQWEIIDYAN